VRAEGRLSFMQRKESLLQGNQGFGTLSVRRKNPMSSKGCWTLRRKVGAVELEAMANG
jgi:hypothetical protein